MPSVAETSHAKNGHVAPAVPVSPAEPLGTQDTNHRAMTAKPSSLLAGLRSLAAERKDARERDANARPSTFPQFFDSAKDERLFEEAYRSHFHQEATHPSQVPHRPLVAPIGARRLCARGLVRWWASINLAVKLRTAGRRSQRCSVACGVASPTPSASSLL